MNRAGSGTRSIGSSGSLPSLLLSDPTTRGRPFLARCGDPKHKTKCVSTSTKASHANSSHAAITINVGVVEVLTKSQNAESVPHLPPAPTGHNIVTPICIAVLDHILECYEPILRKFLVAGFRQGFRIGALGTIPVFDINTRNLQSAFKFPAVIDENFSKELALDLWAI